MAFVPNASQPERGDAPLPDGGLNFQTQFPAGLTVKPPAAARANPAALRAQRQYQQTQIETASPTRLIVLLYDGAIRFCTQGLEALQAQRYEEQNTYLIKAQRIMAELRVSLNREAGGDVAANLHRLYTYLIEQLVRTNMYDDATSLQDVIKTLSDLRETWIELDRMQGRSPSGGAASTSG